MADAPELTTEHATEFKVEHDGISYGVKRILGKWTATKYTGGLASYGLTVDGWVLFCSLDEGHAPARYPTAQEALNAAFDGRAVPSE